MPAPFQQNKARRPVRLPRRLRRSLHLLRGRHLRQRDRLSRERRGRVHETDLQRPRQRPRVIQTVDLEEQLGLVAGARRRLGLCQLLGRQGFRRAERRDRHIHLAQRYLVPHEHVAVLYSSRVTVSRSARVRDQACDRPRGRRGGDLLVLRLAEPGRRVGRGRQRAELDRLEHVRPHLRRPRRGKSYPRDMASRLYLILYFIMRGASYKCKVKDFFSLHSSAS